MNSLILTILHRYRLTDKTEGMADSARKKYAIVEDALKKASKKAVPKEAAEALKVFQEMTNELESLRNLSASQVCTDNTT